MKQNSTNIGKTKMSPEVMESYFDYFWFFLRKQMKEWDETIFRLVILYYVSFKSIQQL